MVVGLGQRLARVVLYLGLIFVALIIVVPLAYAVLNGFRTTGQITAQPLAWPDPFYLDNYAAILRSNTFWRSFANSVLIAGLTMLLTLFAGSLAAFALARIQFRGRSAVFNFFGIGLLFPLAVAILPLFLLLHDLGLQNNPWGIVFPQVAFGLPITIVILRPFFRSIPAELEDASAIDGCSRFGFYRRILMPMSRPALSTVAVLSIVGSWNAFLLPLVVTNSADQWTLPLAVRNFQAQYTQDTASVLAFAALSMIPALVFYIAAERQIVGGLAAVAVKG
jgi:raffinose/stachyose/melibiose transport system permease protein